MIMQSQFKAPQDPDEVGHLTCCATNDPGVLALCGVDVSDEDWEQLEDDEDVECRVCRYLAGTNFCPHLGRCP